MITIDALKAAGANTDEGLARCMNNEAFYLRMVGMALADEGYEKLAEAVRRGDLNEGFERAHALKGILSNVSLTSLAEPVIEITEDLRDRKEKDYSELLEKIASEVAKYRALAE